MEADAKNTTAGRWLLIGVRKKKDTQKKILSADALKLLKLHSLQ